MQENLRHVLVARNGAASKAVRDRASHKPTLGDDHGNDAPARILPPWGQARLTVMSFLITRFKNGLAPIVESASCRILLPDAQWR